MESTPANSPSAPPGSATSPGFVSSLEVQNEAKPQVFLSRLNGQAGAGQAKLLEQHVTLLSARDEPVVVVDLSGLTFISSVGISALMKVHENLKKRGHQLRVSGIHPPITAVIQRCRLDRHFNTFPTVEEALK